MQEMILQSVSKADIRNPLRYLLMNAVASRSAFKWLSFCQKICLNIIDLSFQIIFLFMTGNTAISNRNAVFRLYI